MYQVMHLGLFNRDSLGLRVKHRHSLPTLVMKYPHQLQSKIINLDTQETNPRQTYFPEI